MEISFFINRPPPFVGGLQNVCLKVAKHFQESASATVRIIGFPDQDNSDSRRSWEHEGVEVQELRRGWWENLLLRWVPFLKRRRATFPVAIACYEWAYSRQISRLCQRSSVFHYFGTGMEMNGYPVARAANKIGAKLVIEPAIHAGTWGDTWLDTPLYSKADLLLAHTDFEAGIIQKLGIPNSKIRTIVHGVDFCDSGDGERFRARHEITGPMVLFLGRKTVTKGVGRLLEAWPMVAENFPASTLVIAGPKSEALRQMADGRWWIVDAGAAESPRTDSRWLIADSAGGAKALDARRSTLDTVPKVRILNLDDLAEGEKQDALAACDVLCVPSEGESFGMVYFEAWAYKKPVVALDLPVLQETIGRHGGGLLCKPEPSDIAESLIEFLGNLELQKAMGAKGYAAVGKHDWPRALESYSIAYHNFKT